MTYSVLVINAGGHASCRSLIRERAISLATFIRFAFPHYLVTVIREDDGAAVPLPPLFPIENWKNVPQYASA